MRISCVRRAASSGAVSYTHLDHQTKNALALVDKGAAIYVKDVEAKEKLLPVALETIANPEKLQDLSKNIAKLALPDSATIIAKEVLKLIKK